MHACGKDTNTGFHVTVDDYAADDEPRLGDVWHKCTSKDAYGRDAGYHFAALSRLLAISIQSAIMRWSSAGSRETPRAPIKRAGAGSRSVGSRAQCAKMHRVTDRTCREPGPHWGRTLSALPVREIYRVFRSLAYEGRVATP